MLTHRTNVLFSTDEHNLLRSLSREHGKTMGELIRQAVKKTYKIKTSDSFEQSLARIRKLTEGVKVTRQELRDWVVSGRKYDD